MEALKKICNDYLAHIESDEYHEDNDWAHYIYEAALKAVLGDDIFDRIRDIHKQKSIKKKKAEITRLQSEIGHGGG